MTSKSWRTVRVVVTIPIWGEDREQSEKALARQVLHELSRGHGSYFDDRSRFGKLRVTGFKRTVARSKQ